jgi:IS4 transposase
MKKEKASKKLVRQGSGLVDNGGASIYVCLSLFYKQRWHIELDIRNIKETLGMNILSCKSPELAIKEVWVYLLSYNLIRLMMAQSALLSDLMPRQISFMNCLCS